ncbi:MAG: hypothetical protein WBC07_07760 [Methylotenera sp.]
MKPILKLLAALIVFTPFLVVAAEGEDKCLGQPVIELVTFSVNKGVTGAQIKLAAKKVTPTLKKLNGFKSRSFVHDHNGKWVDIVYWKNMKSALSASALMMENETALLFFSLINPKDMTMMHLCEQHEPQLA